MATFIEDLLDNYQEDNPKNRIVYQIVNCIKNESDFDKALQLLIDSGLSFEDVISRTCRLNFFDVINLADLFIEKSK